jgi:hypothetical protein
MPAALAVMLLALLCNGRTKGRKGLVVIESWGDGMVLFRLVAAPGS